MQDSRKLKTIIPVWSSMLNAVQHREKTEKFSLKKWRAESCPQKLKICFKTARGLLQLLTIKPIVKVGLFPKMQFISDRKQLLRHKTKKLL